MSRLDDELAAAADDGVDDDGVDAVDTEQVEAVTKPATAETPKRNIGLLIGLLVIAAGVLALVFTSFKDEAVYSRGVDDLVQEHASLKAAAASGASEETRNKARLHARSLRVEGTLVKGSLKRRDNPCEYRFTLEKNGKRLDMRYAQCVVPDTFRDRPEVDVQVTATGKLTEEGHFEATEILAKCPSKYEMKQRAKAGETAPHAEVTSPAGTPAQ